MATKNIDLLKDIPPDSKGDGGSKDDQIENIAIDKETFINNKAEEPFLEENLPENKYLTQIQRGQQLAIQFREHNIHPILIFGASKSGKTSFIASLFQYILTGTHQNATIALYLEAIPTDATIWQDMRKYALRLFNKKLIDFVVDGAAAPATQDPIPFFIPVELTPNGRAPVKFAFLEGQGEWYQPDHDADNPYRPFQGEIEGVLKNFNRPLTIIYIAPVTSAGYATLGSEESPESREMADRDQGLLGAMQQYTTLRKEKRHMDNNMFLVTKWDIQSKSITDNSFRYPGPEKLESVIQARYKLAYPNFLNSNDLYNSNETKKCVSHYCSGVISGGSVDKQSVEDKSLIDFFPRKIWNWLYFHHAESVLYPDVHPKKPHILDKILNWLKGNS